MDGRKDFLAWETHRRKEYRALFLIFCELYRLATPPVDLKKLVMESPLDEDGRVLIPFGDYKIDGATYQFIIDSVCRKFKIPKYLRREIQYSCDLGATPKTK